MKNLAGEILNIIDKAGCKLRPGLIFIIVSGTIFESLSVGLVMPLIIILSKGKTDYTSPLFNSFYLLTGSSSYGTFLLWIMGFLVMLYLIKTVFIAFVNASQNRFISQLEVKLSQKLLKIYIEQPYESHLQKNTAQLTKNIYTEIKQLCSAINQALIFFSEGLILLLLALILFYFQPFATMSAVVVLGAIVFVFIRFIRKKLRRWAADRHKNDTAQATLLSNILNNIKDIKLYGRNAEFYKEYNEKSGQSAFALMKYNNFQKLPAIWLEFVAVFSLIMLIGVMVFRGNALTAIIPLLTLFAAAMFRILPSINRISLAYQTIKFYTPVIHTVYGELNMQPDNIEFKGVKQQLKFTGKLLLKDVSFTYNGSAAMIFTGLTLSINKGDYVGLVGQSGSGKSTLIDIIIGLLNPKTGQVQVDGVNIQDNLRGWQDQIGYVAQMINLMDDTISNNITFGTPKEDIDINLLKQAITDAQLEDFITAQPQGLETVVGERGVRLSGGQRQRIGIARALYHNPAVLVLDEATSSLDTKTEAEIMRSVKLLKTKKTIIFITHKNELLKDCDQVYELKNGKLIPTFIKPVNYK